MNAQDTSGSYAELSKEAYKLIVDNFAAANQRTLAYAKSVWEIASRPYSSTAIDGAIRENLERTNQIVALSFGEAQTNAQTSAEFANKLAAHAGKFQDATVQAMRGVVNTSVSNMNFVKDTASKGFEDVNHRLSELQERAQTQVSAN